MLKEQIKADTTVAQKASNELVVETLRMLLAAILTKEKDKKFKEKLEGEATLTDEQIIETVSSEIKKRKDAIVLYEKGNRLELADKEKKEIEILIKYLPEQLSEDEIKKIAEPKTFYERIGLFTGMTPEQIRKNIKGKADILLALQKQKNTDMHSLGYVFAKYYTTKTVTPATIPQLLKEAQ
jgi:uncharacterized protein YqeY